MKKSAKISADKKYRYSLTRIWDEGRPAAFFIMLNPSTADHEADDPTIRRCVNFAKSWGCGRLIVYNLFAVRTSSPDAMKEMSDPVGPENMDMFDDLQMLVDDGDIIVCAWGAHGSFMEQDETVLGWLERYPSCGQPMCLGATATGHPRHPLYVHSSTQLIPYYGKAKHEKV